MKRGIVFLSALLLSAMGVNVCSREPLTFEKRVKAQEAIERVYYNHRIWPKENPQPKPSFEKMVPKEVIEAKVTDYLKKSAALDKFWQRPIVASQLQAEMDRMAKGSKDPATLNELFAALNNDPYLIAECLARPVLADRLIHNWYCSDERFHKEEREMAEEALRNLTHENFAFLDMGEYSLVTYKLEGENEEEREELPEEQDHLTRLSKEEWEKTLTKYPGQGKISSIEETEELFFIAHAIKICQDEARIETRVFTKKSFSEWWRNAGAAIQLEKANIEGAEYSFSIPHPEAACESDWVHSSLNDMIEARYYHTAVWTGTEMIIWGGGSGGAYGSDLNTGGKYNPSTDTWTSTATGTNCPAVRHSHTAVWTGTEMIVWGGVWINTGTDGGTATKYLNTGGSYDPLSDSWTTSTSTETNCPSSRTNHTAVWTGTEMIIWGGLSSYGYLGDGGRYSPTTNNWTTMSTTNVPSPRRYHSAIWTEGEMIIWGGSSGSGIFNTGGRYNSTSDTWTATSTGTDCPSARLYHTAVWTGSKMIVWGGFDAVLNAFYNSGGIYDPSTNVWSPSSTGTDCPMARRYHTAVWTGTEMIVWGGMFSSSTPYYTGTGGRFNPASNTWIPTSTGAGCPSIRAFHTAVWTNSEMIIWGGYNSNYCFNTGGRYNPSSDSWISMAANADIPSVRRLSPAVWTGSEFIVWGGYSGLRFQNTGGKYNPTIDDWSLTSTGTDVPIGREGHTAVWTGTEMVIWGGYNAGYLNNGGRYNPSSDTWTATSIGANCPSARYRHTSVWTGTIMIVWGGGQWKLPWYGGNIHSLFRHVDGHFHRD